MLFVLQGYRDSLDIAVGLCYNNLGKAVGTMLMVYLLLAMCAFFIRMLSGYDSRYQKGKYVSIKNTVISKIALDDISVYSKTKRLKRDMNKMAARGVYLYSALAAVLVINVVLLIIPDIPCESWIIDTERFLVFADTLNDKISAISILLLFLSIIACLGFSFISMKEITPKWIKILIRVVAVFMLLAAAAITVYLLIELIYTCL